ncbi:transcription factor ilr3 [Phtheirospermum japonicum]|uniref:Transcription factor ilr3 n=1 Tax=Phtheirospermum japonicum TaxID=374723 RepID=A0A830C6Y1_9LAMI|nr:transcription factor ilr3 [Phtheirospermum japonicum]
MAVVRSQALLIPSLLRVSRWRREKIWRRLPELRWSPAYVFPSVEIDGSLGESDVPKETGTKKRSRTEACAPSSSKACREKLRRDKLNDRFIELAALLEPGRPPKIDKSAILADAVRMNELRDEKQRLKAEKENLEQQLKTMNAPQPSFLPGPPAMPAAFASQGQAAAGNKLVPIISYPGVAMWQFMPPAAVDTS